MSPRGRLAVALVSTLLVGYVAVGSLLGRVLGDTTYGQLAVFNEVVRLVIDAYVEPVNVDRAMMGARMGLTDALDGDSAYLDADELRAYQQGPKEGEAGIGAILTRRFSFLMVAATRAGSPAAKAGLRPGDIVKTIDGRHSRSLSPPTGHRLLRGEPGSIVKLTLLRAGTDPIDVSVVRERLVPVAPERRVLADGTGYLKVSEFTPRAGEDVRGELEALRRAGASRLVLDLRGTGGGAPAEGVKVAELFLQGGAVGTLAGAKVSEQVLSADPARSAWSSPVAVLVDSGTSGAAEVVTAALLDAGRPIVGEHTFGRAAVQKVVPLPEGGLLLTVAKYVSPKGTAVHGKGIEPTVPVAVPDEDGDEAAPAGDPVLEKALEVLKDPAALDKAA
ncbi:MAG TPA: S41 family peptidase [Vicinamibacteria bacterium]|nr:S41 family peptidase [Vicinamibacteria bacterium]